ncbi:MAG: hypothetical protein R3242_03315 [Akkermansiaceae bacterium]|nr:hypothetical protein [Akkermansiaceae bacterium]
MLKQFVDLQDRALVLHELVPGRKDLRRWWRVKDLTQHPTIQSPISIAQFERFHSGLGTQNHLAIGRFLIGNFQTGSRTHSDGPVLIIAHTRVIEQGLQKAVCPLSLKLQPLPIRRLDALPNQPLIELRIRRSHCPVRISHQLHVETSSFQRSCPRPVELNAPCLVPFAWPIHHGAYRRALLLTGLLLTPAPPFFPVEDQTEGKRVRTKFARGLVLGTGAMRLQVAGAAYHDPQAMATAAFLDHAAPTIITCAHLQYRTVGHQLLRLLEGLPTGSLSKHRFITALRHGADDFRFEPRGNGVLGIPRWLNFCLGAARRTS